jgi:hypothetical protein
LKAPNKPSYFSRIAPTPKTFKLKALLNTASFPTESCPLTLIKKRYFEKISKSDVSHPKVEGFQK